jgi:mRNA interferase MazF
MVVTSDVVNARRRTVVVVPLSTGPRVSPPLLIALSSVGRPAVAALDQLRAVTKERFQERLGTVSQAELEAVEDGLREILEL